MNFLKGQAMATTKDDAAVNPLANSGDHDRVTMLSLRVDGTPDQINPEIIGDKDVAIAAAKVQFAQQAVAAVDAEKRAELGLGGASGPGDTSDAAIDALKAEHDKVAEAAESRAEAMVNALHKGDEPAATPAAPAAAASKTTTK